jgi:tetratricopeptide (TPR) repeat protein
MDMKNLKRTVLTALLVGVISGCGSAEESSEKFIESGKELMNEGDYDKARLEFRNALQINPLEAEGYYQLALIDEKNQNWKGMYANLSTVESLEPNHVNAIVKLGQIQLLSGRLDEAMERAEKALSLEPENIEATLLQATVFIKQEKFNEAEKQIDQALSIDSTSMEALSARIMLYKETEQYDAALTAADEALVAHPDSLPVKMIKLSIYEAQKDFNAMESLLASLSEEMPDESWIAISRTKLLNDGLNRPQDARKVMEDYIAANPDDIETKLAYVGFLNNSDADAAVAKLDQYLAENPDNQELRFAKLEMLQRQGKTDDMVAELEAIIASEPDSDSGLRAKAVLAGLEASKENFDQAEKMADEVLAIDSQNEQALLIKSKLQIRNEDFDSAISNLRTIIRNNPEADEAMVLLAQVYMKTGSAQLAENSFRQALSVNPRNPQAAMSVASSLMRSNDLDRTENVLIGALEGNPESEELLQALAQVRILKRDWAGTQTTLESLGDSESALTHLLSAQMYQGLQDYTLAISEYDLALQIDPGLTRALQELARSYVRLEQQEEMIEYLNQHIADHPQQLNGYSVLSNYYVSQNDWDAAIGVTEKGIQTNPQWGSGYGMMAGLYQQKGDMEQAVSTYQEGLEKLPEDNVLTLQLASTYEAMGEFQKARDLYEEVISRDPLIDVAANNLASLLTDQFESPENLQRALTLSSRFRDSDQPYFADTFGWVNFKMGNYEDARSALETAASSDDAIALFHYHLGRVYVALSLPEEARQSFERAQRMANEENDEELIAKITEQLSQL